MIRFFGSMLIGCGTLVVLWTLGWVVAYFVERGLDVASLSVAVTTEAGYWAPVLLLGLPGFVLIHHGRCLLLRRGLSVLAIGEVAMVFAILGILVALVFPVDNFSYVAASIVQNGVAAAQPTQSRVAEHHSLHGAFPGPGTVPVASLQARAADRHIRSITHGEGGRVVITFDTRDIEWGWSWWHGLLAIDSNDLTGQTVVLVPSMVEGAVVWDECTEGTVPKRNRHFKCSGHR